MICDMLWGFEIQLVQLGYDALCDSPIVLTRSNREIPYSGMFKMCAEGLQILDQVDGIAVESVWVVPQYR